MVHTIHRFLQPTLGWHGPICGMDHTTQEWVHEPVGGMDLTIQEWVAGTHGWNGPVGGMAHAT